SDSNSADAVRSVAEEQAEVVFLGNTPDARLSHSKPALRAEMLEERMHTLRPFVLASQNWERACNLGFPPWSVGKARPSARGIFESTGVLDHDNVLTLQQKQKVSSFALCKQQKSAG